MPNYLCLALASIIGATIALAVLVATVANHGLHLIP